MGTGASKDITSNPTFNSKKLSSKGDHIDIGSRASAGGKAVAPISSTPTSKTEDKPSLGSKPYSYQSVNKTSDIRATAKSKAVAPPLLTSTSKITTITNIDNDTDEQQGEIVVGSDIHRPVTAAIDFGTTSSGFAFVFEDSPNDVHINKWVLGSSEKEKAPTAVLLKKDKSFYSFGYTAEEDYARLCESGGQKGWRYFHLFKMELYRKDDAESIQEKTIKASHLSKQALVLKKLSRNTDLFDVENKPMPALEILAIVICFLKKKILETIRLQRQGVSDDDVMYVITVPAIWSDAAKQLMREAATGRVAGIHDDQLRLVLEPEAASVYCSGQRVMKQTGGSSDGEQFQRLPVGQTYILCDIGGGTLDLATHQIIPDGRLHEKYVARGNGIGGHYFNKKCLEFLENLFGPDCFQRWKNTDSGDFLTLERDIEEMKRKVGERKDDVQLNIRPTLLDLHRESTGGKGIEIFETKAEFSAAICSANSRKGCIILKNSFLRNFIKETTVAIETYLTTIIKAEPSVKLIFLVGGLAKSPYVRQYIESRFPDCRVVVPEDPGVAVLKGAVLLGNRPQTIASRLARYSYGIDVRDDFIPGVHREEYKITVDGKVRCKHVFEKLIEKGEVLQYGQRFKITTWVNAKLPERKQRTVHTFLYQSTKTSPMYITEDGCTKLGGFDNYPPEGGWPDYCEQKIELIVGEAEFKLELSDDLDRKYETKIDFLLPSE